MKQTVLLLMMLANNVYASCTCVCVNGEATQICTASEIPHTLCNIMCSGVDGSGNSNDVGEK